jgi:hypothetical protein
MYRLFRESHLKCSNKAVRDWLKNKKLYLLDNYRIGRTSSILLDSAESLLMALIFQQQKMIETLIDRLLYHW